ncbi:MAG: UbiA family prenyltransferase, partial [Alphaproteobacteria bacterium]
MSDAAPTPSESDIAAHGWVDRYVPAAARPYCILARLDRPIGTWLLLWPCWWGLALASPEPESGPWLMALFAVGALVMRGAGCTINDIADRDLDAQVARTATRPLASGALKPVQAWLFLAALLAAGLIVLVQFNHADGAPSRHEQDPFEWNLAESGIVAGDLVRFWAQATDRNNVTGPGQAVSRRYTIFVITPEQIKAGLAFDIEALAAFLEQLIRL